MTTSTQSAVSTRTIKEVATIIAGNRLEPRSRSHEFSRSLRAEVRDATWMLTRQWQLKEFRGENQGSIAQAKVEYQAAALDRIQLGTGSVLPLEDSVPVDTWVQQQGVLNEALGLEPSAESRLQGGVYWFRLLKSRQLTHLKPHFLDAEEYELQTANSTNAVAYALESTLAEAQQLLLGAAGRIPDGYRLYIRLRDERSLAVQAALGPILSAPAVQAFNAVADLYIAWFERSYPAEENPAWSAPDLQYKFSVAAPDTGGGSQVLTAPGYDGALLEWYTFNKEPQQTGTPAFYASRQSSAGTGGTGNTAEPNPLTDEQVFLPTEIQFPGSPNARWWEFEDRRVDFGQLTGDPSDFGRMLLQEFMFLYQNDWFILPFTGKRGTVAAIKSLTITDVFGFTYNIQPAGQQEQDNSTVLEGDWGPWSMYAISEAGNRRSSTPSILISPASVGTQVGPPVERITLMREEATNMVWAVEQTIPDGLGRGMDGSQAANRVRERLRDLVGVEPQISSNGTQYRYQLETTVPENWIPFIPTLHPNSSDPTLPPFYDYLLEQGAMPRRGYLQSLARVEPRTSFLKRGSRKLLPGGAAADNPYYLHESKVPPTGITLGAEYRRARWYDGRTYVWYCYQAGPVSPLGGSGLVYDQLKPLEQQEPTDIDEEEIEDVDGTA